MWLPCNFGDKVMISKWSNGHYEEYTFIGVCRGCFNLYSYEFVDERDRLIILDDEDKYGYSHRDVKNDKYLKQSSLKPVEVDLLIEPGISKPFNELFDTKKKASGKLVSLTLQKDGTYLYHFVDSTGIGVDFTSDKVLIKGEAKEIVKCDKDGQVSLF